MSLRHQVKPAATREMVNFTCYGLSVASKPISTLINLETGQPAFAFCCDRLERIAVNARYLRRDGEMYRRREPVVLNSGFNAAPIFGKCCGNHTAATPRTSWAAMQPQKLRQRFLRRRRLPRSLLHRCGSHCHDQHARSVVTCSTGLARLPLPSSLGSCITRSRQSNALARPVSVPTPET